MEQFEAEARRWLQPDETAAQLLARTFVAPLRTGLPLVDRFLSFRGGQVLEIVSAAGCGRTTALLQVAATCILPELLGGVPYGGRAGGRGAGRGACWAALAAGQDPCGCRPTASPLLPVARSPRAAVRP